MSGGQGHPAFLAWADGLADLHREKSGGYGTDADPFANFTAVAAASGRQRWEYAVERIVEKCVRIQSLTAHERFAELAEEFRDIGGLAGCGHAMLDEDYINPHPTVFMSEPARVEIVDASNRVIGQTHGGFSDACRFPHCGCYGTCVEDEKLAKESHV